MRDGGREDPSRGLYLPSGYRLDETTDHDAVILRREDGSEVTAFGEKPDPREVERAAWEDRRGREEPPEGD